MCLIVSSSVWDEVVVGVLSSNLSVVPAQSENLLSCALLTAFAEFG